MFDFILLACLRGRTITSSFLFPAQLSLTNHANIERWIQDLTNMGMDGSAKRPWITVWNPERPEANGGAFGVDLVTDLHHRDFKRTGFHIRVSTSVFQRNDWSAKIPFKEYPMICKRSILITGPSQPHSHRNPGIYHSEDRPCAATRSVHNGLQNDIDKEKDRLLSHWLIVLPSHTVLENYTFSDDECIVRTHSKLVSDVTTMEFEDDNGNVTAEEVEIWTAEVWWKVAIAGGTQIAAPQVAARPRARRRARNNNNRNNNNRNNNNNNDP